MVAAPFAAFGQQPLAQVHRNGFLGVQSASDYATRLEALRTGLRELGYLEARNIVIESRWAEGKYDRLPGLAAELVGRKVDVLVVDGLTAALAAKRTTATTPVVVANVGDPVNSGLIDSYAKPGGNVTGMSFLAPELTAKRLELVKQAKPSIAKVAVLIHPANPAFVQVLRVLRSEAERNRMRIEPIDVREADELESAFLTLATRGVDAIVVHSDTMFFAHAKSIAALAAKYRIASVGTWDFGKAGGLIGYGVNTLDNYRHIAVFVDKILKGAKPADLPVEQPTKVELVVNLKTAKAVGLRIPQSVLLRADEVIQ